MPDLAKREVRILGVPVHSIDHQSVLAEVAANITGRRLPRYISITNTESMFHAQRMAAHMEYIEKADFSLCDGIGVVAAAMFSGKRLERFNGPVLMLEACKFGIDQGWRHFFCGGKPGVAELLSTRLSEKFPGLITAGTWTPPFGALSTEEESAMLSEIRRARPDIVWVGLGLLKQEAWIRRYREEVGVPWMVGVGAAFDFHAGTAVWAPRVVRRAGLEWLYRLFHEPRMLKRNYWSLCFVLMAFGHAMRSKLSWNTRQ